MNDLIKNIKWNRVTVLYSSGGQPINNLLTVSAYCPGMEEEKNFYKKNFYNIYLLICACSKVNIKLLLHLL